MVAGLISGVVGQDWASMIIIFVIVFLSVILDFYQVKKFFLVDFAEL
jgi:hypothetical protein